MFALNAKSAAELNRQMTSGKIKKIYLAVTEGEIKTEKAILEDWLKKNNRTNSSAVVAAGTAGAKKAVLSYEVLETKRIEEEGTEQDGKVRSLVQICLDTGRHHQIRVQMSHAGDAACW